MACRLHSFVLVLAAASAPLTFAACSSNSGSPVYSSGDDASSSSSGGGGTSSSSGGGSSSGTGSSSGSSSPHDGGSSSSSSGGGSGRVPSNVMFNDAGIPLCGTGPCDLAHGQQCCVSSLGVASCVAQGTACPGTSSSNPAAIFKCVDQTDCPAHQVCCGTADSIAMTAGSECQDVSTTNNQCTPANSLTKGSAQLCQTNAECKTGQCIWQDCMVGTLAPSLTMCGLQSQMPFNCKAH